MGSDSVGMDALVGLGLRSDKRKPRQNFEHWRREKRGEREDGKAGLIKTDRGRNMKRRAMVLLVFNPTLVLITGTLIIYLSFFSIKTMN